MKNGQSMKATLNFSLFYLVDWSEDDYPRSQLKTQSVFQTFQTKTQWESRSDCWLLLSSILIVEIKVWLKIIYTSVPLLAIWNSFYSVPHCPIHAFFVLTVMLVHFALHLTEKMQVLPYFYLYFKTAMSHPVREAKWGLNFQKIVKIRF